MNTQNTENINYINDIKFSKKKLNKLVNKLINIDVNISYKILLNKTFKYKHLFYYNTFTKIFKKCPDFIKIMFELNKQNYISINSNMLLTTHNENGWSILHYLVFNDIVTLCKLLTYPFITQELIELQDNEGNNFLHFIMHHSPEHFEEITCIINSYDHLTYNEENNIDTDSFYDLDDNIYYDNKIRISEKLLFSKNNNNNTVFHEYDFNSPTVLEDILNCDSYDIIFTKENLLLTNDYGETVIQKLLEINNGDETYFDDLIGIIYESGCIDNFLELIQEDDSYVPNNFMNYICKEFYPKSLLEVINSEYFNFEYLSRVDKDNNIPLSYVNITSYDPKLLKYMNNNIVNKLVNDKIIENEELQIYNNIKKKVSIIENTYFKYMIPKYIK